MRIIPQSLTVILLDCVFNLFAGGKSVVTAPPKDLNLPAFYTAIRHDILDFCERELVTLGSARNKLGNLGSKCAPYWVASE